LSEGLLELARDRQIELTADQARQLEAYCHRLWEWNERLNLTRHVTFGQFVDRDLVDSVRLSGHLRAGETVLDVGSGGGVPGIPLAILRPDVSVSLCESVGKKARALQAMVADLGLSTPVLAERAEAVLARHAFDTVVARAVGSMATLLRWLQPHWDRMGRLLLVKGPKWPEERKEARHYGLLRTLELRRLESYTMPGTRAESTILVLWRKTPEGAPQ
jgi:16S rRNA (guanine527-N7)-methyltransferase